MTAGPKRWSTSPPSPRRSAHRNRPFSRPTRCWRSRCCRRPSRRRRRPGRRGQQPHGLRLQRPDRLGAGLHATGRDLTDPAVERVRVVEAGRRGRDVDVRSPARRPGAARRVPPLLRDRPRGVAGRDHPAGSHRGGRGWPTRPCRLRRCSTTSTPATPPRSSCGCWSGWTSIPNGETFIVGADDALGRTSAGRADADLPPGHRGGRRRSHRNRTRLLQREGQAAARAGSPSTPGAASSQRPRPAQAVR